MGIEVVRVTEWARYPWLVHGFSTRTGGVSTVYGGQTLNLGWTKEDSPSTVAENRKLLMEEVGAAAPKLATLRQVHGTGIRVVNSAQEEMQGTDGRALYDGDGLMTIAPGVLLGIQTADCVPVMIVDVAQRVVAVLHAGWRGTVAGMARCGVERMQTEFGARLADLVAAVGPAIGPCCYEVGDQVRAAFLDKFVYGEELFRGEKSERLNLWEANRRQLVEGGIAAGQVNIVGECTACSCTAMGERRYFSHRAEDGKTGRMMSVVGVRDSHSGTATHR